MPLDFTAYAKDLAINLKSIGHVDGSDSTRHFYRVSSTSSLEEILQHITNLSGLNLAVEDNEEGGLKENNSAAMFDRKICSFFLLQKAAINDADAAHTIKRSMKTEINKIIAKIRRDYKTDNEGTTDTGMRNIDWGSFSYFTFGPVLDGYFGLHCSFVVDDNIKFTYNAADWIS